MLTLHLIRHAKTETTATHGGDRERDLTPKGVSQSNLLGKHIRCQHIELGEVHSSSANRTQQTTSIILQHQIPQPDVYVHPELYLAKCNDLFEWVQGNSEPIVTIVGHNDGLSELATYFLDEDINLQTADLISMTFPFTDWSMVSKGTATLNFRYRPQVYLPQMLVQKV